MTEDIEVGRFSQAAPDLAAEFKEEKDTTMGAEGTKPQWQYALTELDLLPESDTVLLWLARFPIENNHPRPLVAQSISRTAAAGEVLTVEEDEKLPHVFAKLVTEGFLGCPVVDSEHRFLCFVDMLDLVHYVCDMFQDYMERSNEINYVPSEQKLKEDWSRFFKLDNYQNATIREVALRSKAKMPFSYPSFRGFSTFSAVEQMARLGPQRVAVLDRERRVLGILTQSMVISLLDQNSDKLGLLRDCKVREMLPALACQAICVQETTLTIDAFRLMARITGLGVTNSEGSLVDTLSVRDLRGMGVNAEHFERLWHTVARYKEEVRRDFKRQTPPKPIHVTRDDTLRHVITRMDDGNIHRVFVVEKQRREGGSGEELWRPTHVITQRDVMRFLLFKMGLQPIWEVEPLP